MNLHIFLSQSFVFRKICNCQTCFTPLVAVSAGFGRCNMLLLTYWNNCIVKSKETNVSCSSAVSLENFANILFQPVLFCEASVCLFVHA